MNEFIGNSGGLNQLQKGNSDWMFKSDKYKFSS